MAVTAVTEAPKITTSMGRFIEQRPELRYTFFGGKGGVGKTTLAGIMSARLASQGKRTLLASTNPVHSLSGLLDQDVFGKATAVSGVDNMWAFEIDTRESIERSKREIKENDQ